MEESKHTQGEWKLSHSPAARCLKSRASIGVIKSRVFKSIKNQSTIGGSIIANAYGDSVIEAEDNAKRIVKCCNMHDELISMIEQELDLLEEWNGNGNYINRIEEMKKLLNKAQL